MADTKTVCTILNTTSLELVNHLCNIHGNGAELRVRHKATRTKNTTKTANLTHHLRGCDCCVKVKHALLDLCDELVATDDVSASCLSLAGLLALCEDCNANGLTSAVRQRNGTANVLVSLTSIDTKANCYLNGLVKLSSCKLLRQGYCLFWAVEVCTVYLGNCILVVLSVLRHYVPPVVSGRLPSHSCIFRP